MAQYLFGPTSYEEQSLNDIKADIIKWINYTKSIREKMDALVKEAKKVVFGARLVWALD